MSGRPQKPGDELRFAAAGPAVTAVIAAIFGALALILPASAPAALRALIKYQAEVNLFILGFNLLPAFPLDGGRIARALLWRGSGDISAATDTAAGLGRGFGYLLIALGVVSWLGGAVGGLWFAVIGFFLVSAAGAERVQEQVIAALTGVTVRELMSTPVITISSELTLSDAQRYFQRYRYTAFPVIDAAGHSVGLLSIGRLEKPLDRSGTTGSSAGSPTEIRRSSSRNTRTSRPCSSGRRSRASAAQRLSMHYSGRSGSSR